jgi:hypothetical protein
MSLLGRSKLMWGWLGGNKDQLTILFGIVAGVTALVLKYIERFQDSRVSSARSKIAEALLDAEKRADFDNAYVAAMTSKDKDAKALQTFMLKHDLNGQLVVLAEHYMNLSTCVEAKICDRELACKSFKSDIEATYLTFQPLFTGPWKSSMGRDYMEKPRQFAKACASLPNSP